MTTVIEPGYRNHIGYQGALLGGFVTLATALLVIGNLSTVEPIAKRQEEDLLNSLAQVIPAEIHENNLLDNTISITEKDKKPVQIYRAQKGQTVTAVAYGITAQGYAGEIRIILGIDKNGEVLGVRVLAHTETPGLGDKIEEKKSHWILGFNGLSLSNTPDSAWGVKKDHGRFDQFSGATITPRGVIKAIKQGLKFFNTHKTVLLEMQQAEPRETNLK